MSSTFTHFSFSTILDLKVVSQRIQY